MNIIVMEDWCKQKINSLEAKGLENWKSDDASIYNHAQRVAAFCQASRKGKS